MKIELKEDRRFNKILIISATDSVEEDRLIEKWSGQIQKHLDKLNLKI